MRFSTTRRFEARAATVARHLLEDNLLEHCGQCGTPTKVMLKPQPRVDLDKISAEEKRMGTQVEKEHVTKAKEALAVAAGHWAEDPKYYAHGKKKGVFPELKTKAKAMFGMGMVGDSPGMAGGVI